MTGANVLLDLRCPLVCDAPFSCLTETDDVSVCEELSTAPVEAEEEEEEAAQPHQPASASSSSSGDNKAVQVRRQASTNLIL